MYYIISEKGYIRAQAGIGYKGKKDVYMLFR